jgi:hypothetical protein
MIQYGIERNKVFERGGATSLHMRALYLRPVSVIRQDDGKKLLYTAAFL